RGGSLSVAPALPPWWWDEAGADEAALPLEGDVAADFCVVGGGYTGLWTALALREREPSARVVVLEADVCGAGPSGRNGGFLHGYWAALSDLVPLLGDGRALELARAGERIVPAVRELCAARGEDVWLREGGMLLVSTAAAQDAAVERAVAAAGRVGAPDEARALAQEEVGER